MDNCDCRVPNFLTSIDLEPAFPLFPAAPTKLIVQKMLGLAADWEGARFDMLQQIRGRLNIADHFSQFDPGGAGNPVQISQVQISQAWMGAALIICGPGAGVGWGMPFERVARELRKAC